MTDRLKGCWVAFDRDIREDDARELIGAIHMLKGVQAVATEVASAEDWMNRQRIKGELQSLLFDALNKAAP